MLHIYDNIDNITARTIPWLKGKIKKKLCLPSLLQNIDVETINFICLEYEMLSTLFILVAIVMIVRTSSKVRLNSIVCNKK